LIYPALVKLMITLNFSSVCVVIKFLLRTLLLGASLQTFSITET